MMLSLPSLAFSNSLQSLCHVVLRFQFFAISMSRCLRWSSGLSQFSRRKRFWICLRWFGKQPIWSKEMIKQLGVPPQTFPVLMYAGMYCQKNWVTTWIRRLSDSEKWKVSVLLCTFYSEQVVLAMWLSGSLDDLVHRCEFKSGLIHVTA